MPIKQSGIFCMRYLTLISIRPAVVFISTANITRMWHLAPIWRDRLSTNDLQKKYQSLLARLASENKRTESINEGLGHYLEHVVLYKPEMSFRISSLLHDHVQICWNERSSTFTQILLQICRVSFYVLGLPVTPDRQASFITIGKRQVFCVRDRLKSWRWTTNNKNHRPGTTFLLLLLNRQGQWKRKNRWSQLSGRVYNDVPGHRE